MERKRDGNRTASEQFLTRFISPTRIGFIKIGLSIISKSDQSQSPLWLNSQVEESRIKDMNSDTNRLKKSGVLNEEEEALRRFYELLVGSDKDRESNNLLALQHRVSTQTQLRQQQIALYIREQELLAMQHAQVFSGQVLSGMLQAQRRNGQSGDYRFDARLLLPAQDSQSQSGMLEGMLQPLEQDSSAQSYTFQATLQPFEQDTSSQCFSMDGSLQPFEQDSSDQGCILLGKLQPLVQDDWPAPCKLEATLQPISPSDGMEMNSLSGSLQPVEQTTPVPVRRNEEH